MTEDIFFCYNAKEAPERDKQKTAIKIKGKRQEAPFIAKSFLLTGIEQSKGPILYLQKVFYW